MNFRARLGIVQTGPNLVTNGDFPVDLSGWTAGFGWTWFGGTARRGGGGAASFLSQANVFQIGNRYKVTWDNVGTGDVGVFFGDYGFNFEGAIGSFEEIRYVLSGTDLQFKATGGTIDNVEAYLMEYNAALNDEPIGLNNIKTTVERDRILDALVRESTTELTFWGDNWDFLLALSVTEGLCIEVPTLIQQRCEGGEWEDYFEGIIYLNESSFDFKKCQVKAVVEDRGAAQVLLNGRSIDVFFEDDTDNQSTNYLVDPVVFIDFHDDTGATPASPPYENTLCWSVPALFRRIIHFISAINVEFESEFFGVGGDQEFLMLTLGQSIRQEDVVQRLDEDILNMSFDRLFRECNNVFNLGVLVYYPNGVPTVKIEPKEDLRGSSVLLTLTNVFDPVFTYDNDNQFSSVIVGYNKKQGKDDFKGIQYVSTEVCTSDTLDLLSGFIADSDLIFDLLTGVLSGINDIRNGNFDDDIEWIKGGGWSIGSGVALHVPGSIGVLGQYGITDINCSWANVTFPDSCRYEVKFTLSAVTAGSITPQLGSVSGTARFTSGTFTEIINSKEGGAYSDAAGFLTTSLFSGVLDDVFVKKYVEQDKYDEDWFFVETDGTRTIATGGADVYNDNLIASNIMTRWVDTLQNSFFKDRFTSEVITKTNTALLRVWEFTVPVSKADWDALIDFTELVRFSSKNVAILDGLILEAEREEKSGVTRFKLLTP